MVNVALPSWLDYEATKAGVNVSRNPTGSADRNVTLGKESKMSDIELCAKHKFNE